MEAAAASWSCDDCKTTMPDVNDVAKAWKMVVAVVGACWKNGNAWMGAGVNVNVRGNVNDGGHEMEGVVTVGVGVTAMDCCVKRTTQIDRRRDGDRCALAMFDSTADARVEAVVRPLRSSSNRLRKGQARLQAQRELI